MPHVAPSSIFRPDLLSGSVALITGGGTGLGKAAAIELARCGASVAIAGRRAEVLEAAVQEIAAAAGADDRVAALPADIRDPDEARRLIESVIERFGRLDVLVNNAGGQYFVPAEAIEPKGWRAVHRLNVGATELMTRTAYDLAFKPAGAGAVINVTLSPHQGLAGMTHSSTARAAVEGYTRALADEWVADGISVVALAAGHYETDAISKYPEPVRAGAARAVPFGRLGRPEEHAWLVALCASPLGRALSGAVLTLDGARDNWFGPWPPQNLTVEGEVPTEERRPAAT